MTIWFDKARKRWRYDFELQGVRYAKECADAAGNPVANRRAAQDAENDARKVARMIGKIPRAPELTFAQVLSSLSEHWMTTADWPNKQRYARELLAFFGGETLMRDIDGARIQDYIAFAMKQPRMVWIGGSSRKRDAADAQKFWRADPHGRTRAPSIHGQPVSPAAPNGI